VIAHSLALIDHFAPRNKSCSRAVGFCKIVSCSSRSISYMSWSVVSKSDNSVAHWHYNLNLLRLACYCRCCVVTWYTLMVEAFTATHGVYIGHFENKTSGYVFSHVSIFSTRTLMGIVSNTSLYAPGGVVVRLKLLLRAWLVSRVWSQTWLRGCFSGKCNL
jgi:hypothetical protein